MPSESAAPAYPVPPANPSAAGGSTSTAAGGSSLTATEPGRHTGIATFLEVASMWPPAPATGTQQHPQAEQARALAYQLRMRNERVRPPARPSSGGT